MNAKDLLSGHYYWLFGELYIVDRVAEFSVYLRKVTKRKDCGYWYPFKHWNKQEFKEHNP